MNRILKPEEALESEIINYLSSNGYEYIKPEEMKLTFNKKYAVDESRLFSFIQTTQPDVFDKHNLSTDSGKKQFLVNLDNAIKRDGIINILKNGVKMYPTGLILFYHSIDEKIPETKIKFEQNIFAITNQLTYSDKNKMLELDLCIFINGLPVVTMELKSRSASTGWSYIDAEEQYKKDRCNTDTLFAFKRCIAHFAVDENYITFTTKIDGDNTFFMPFNKGKDDGAGNPISDGIMTDYLWKEILEKHHFTSLIKDFCYVVKDEKNKEKLIFPRYHQWRVVNKLIADVSRNGVGQKYLIQHSAGSGKSNSITWLSYKLVEVKKDEKALFDSVVVVTDRKNLDKQISDNIRKFIDVKSAVAHADSSKKLKDLLEDGKKIIMTTVQKFPYIIESIGSNLSEKNFAIIIDEAHSSQSGKAAASLNMSISGKLDTNDEHDIEDLLVNYMESQRMPENASYFAFTATPKAKTIEMFGKVYDLYAMKQAIEEGFILDVLKNYTTYKNYYKVYKTTEENPDFDAKKSRAKIRKYVEGQQHPLEQKAEEMVRHFNETTSKKIGGKAKAMVVTESIIRSIDYYFIISDLLKVSGTGYKAIIAFSGEKEYKGKILSETSINGFSDKETPDVFKKDEYKFLIVADKYQTGYDEPLLHTMYVDKKLNDVKAVQTLSRLNRSYRGKVDTCVLDFYNEADEIKEAFQPYYRETKLMNETDPNKLYTLLSVLDSKYVYEEDEVLQVVDMFFKKADRRFIDPILDRCVERYEALSENDQVEFKSGVKAFIRTYNFLASILPIAQPEWTAKSIFFERLIHRLPTPKEEDLSLGILDNVDLDSYRLEKQNEMNIVLENKEGELEVQGIGVGTKREIEIDTLDNIVNSFNDVFGNIEWQNKDNIVRQIKELPNILFGKETLKNAFLNSDDENIKIEYSNVLKEVMREIMKDNMELFLQFTTNDLFNKWLSSTVYNELEKKYR
ncbi:TPA: type I restriction endonuclease subunit R [Streptococcus suis]|nr:type I restriction endonuclease subunit R [Streptococcus suis]